MLAHVAGETGETTPSVDLTEWAEGIVARLDYLASQELLGFCLTPDGFNIQLTYSGWNFREFHRAKRSDLLREKLMWPVIVSVVSYGLLELIKWLVGRAHL